jgi:hypothetical protein
VTIAVVVLAGVVVLLAAERWQQQRRADANLLELIGLTDRLCQRLQAPQAAVLEHDEQVRALRGDEYAPPAVPPDDDEAYWASREKLAELLMAQETDGH